MPKSFSEVILRKYYRHHERSDVVTVDDGRWVLWSYLQVRYDRSMSAFAKALDEHGDRAIASDGSTILHAIAVSPLLCKRERMQIALDKYPDFLRQTDAFGRTPVYYAREGTDFLLSRMEKKDDEHRDHSGLTAIQFRIKRKSNYHHLVEWANAFPDNASFILSFCISEKIYDDVDALIPRLSCPDDILKANLAIGFCIGIPKNPLCHPYFVRAAEIRPGLHPIFFSDNYQVFLDWCRDEYFATDELSFVRFLMGLIEREDDFFELRLSAFSEIFNHISKRRKKTITYFVYVLDENAYRYLPHLPEARIRQLTRFMLREDLNEYFDLTEINFVKFITFWLFVYKANDNSVDDSSLMFFRHDKVHEADERGRTVLHYACSERMETRNKRQQSFTNVDMVRWCLQLGNFAINQQDAYGKTPLHLARQFNNLPDVAELLMKSGACDDIPDGRGKTVMDRYPKNTPSSLQCITSRVIAESDIDIDAAPSKIKEFVKIHDTLV